MPYLNHQRSAILVAGGTDAYIARCVGLGVVWVYSLCEARSAKSLGMEPNALLALTVQRRAQKKALAHA